MNSLSRMLTVTADGEPLSFSGRAQLSGQDDLSLFPALFEVNPGDACLVIFADVDIDRWLASGVPEEPGSARKHSLSDGFAFVGLRRDEKSPPESGGDADVCKADFPHCQVEIVDSQRLFSSLAVGIPTEEPQLQAFSH